MNRPKPSTRKAKGVRRGSGSTPVLPPQLEAFAAAYDSTGGNASEAYLQTHPKCHTRRSAAQGGYRLSRHPGVCALIVASRAARWRRLAMSGDEALARVALDARCDVRQLFDEDDKLLPIHAWPDNVAQSVRSIRITKDGVVVTMNDSLLARRIVLEQQGKLKGLGNAVGELARLLAGDIDDDTVKP